MAESTETLDAGAEADRPPRSTLSEYTTQTGDVQRASRRRPAQAGRHRQRARHRPPQGGHRAGAHRRPAPASGRSTTGTLDEYFPNKVHQQLISEPFVTLGAEDQFDVVARIDGGGVSGQAARCAWASPGR